MCAAPFLCHAYAGLTNFDEQDQPDMPNTSAPFQKSAKGSQALAARDPALTPKLRSLLIMVDGKRTTADLSKLAAALGNPQEMLDQLLDLGFIEGAAAAAAPAPAPAPAASAAAAAAPAAAGAPTVPLKDAQRFAVRRLTDLLGPMAESLCMRIEGSKNAAEFMQALHRAEQVLKEFGGQQMTESFIRDMQGHLPA